VTAVELQERFLDGARDFAGRGGFDGIVPRAAEILDLWADTLGKLRAREFDLLAGRLDWVLKLQILRHAMRRRPDLTWGSEEVKHLDHLYSSLDPHEGLFWAYEQAGRVERVVTSDEIDRLVNEPPADTRAWTRAMLLRRAGSDAITDVDWDRIRFRVERRGFRRVSRTVDLPDPLADTRADNESILGDDRLTLDEVADALDERGGTTRAEGREDRWTTDLVGPVGRVH
jgi:proteasome accessory factor A